MDGVLGDLSSGRVKLRKTNVVSDSSAPKLSGFISEKDIRKYQDDVLNVNLEYWVKLLGDITFHTEFYPITLEDAQTFIDCYDLFEKKLPFPEELSQRLNKIEAGLQKVIESVKGSDSGVFVKTSSRSAKDTGVSKDKRIKDKKIKNREFKYYTKQVYHEKFKTLYRKYLKERQAKDENDKIVCLLEAGTYIQKMENAKQVLQMFSISERISQDMKLALAHPDRFEEHFVVRKWMDLDPTLEFRAFVTNNKMNALSQYNHLGFFPHLLENKGEIEKQILEFFNDVARPRLQDKFHTYIIDFALIDLNTVPKKYKIWVIELNPFLPTTDACLFSWEKERSILENGPFEFRYRSAKASGAKALLANAWRDIINEEEA